MTSRCLREEDFEKNLGKNLGIERCIEGYCILNLKSCIELPNDINYGFKNGVTHDCVGIGSQGVIEAEKNFCILETNNEAASL